MTIGQRLINWRKENGLKTNEIHEKTGISLGALSNYENDKREISSNFLLKLKEIYKADIYFILTGVKINMEILTENEKEMLNNFSKLPEREQIKFIGRIEEVAKQYEVEVLGKSSNSKIG